MNRGRWTGGSAAVDGRNLALLAGSAGLHLVVLALIGLDLAARADRPVFADPALMVDLEPWPDFARKARPAPVAAQPTADAGRTVLDASPSLPQSGLPLPSLPQPRQPLSAAAAPPPSPAPAPRSSAAQTPPVAPAQPSGSRADAVGRSLTLPNAWSGDVCRNPADFAAWQAAGCGARPPSARAEVRDLERDEAAIGARRGDAAERRREDGFARQKEMNDRWLDYYRNRDAPYPGLRALLSQM